MKRHFLRFGCAALMMCVLFSGCKKADVTVTATDPQLTFTVIPDNSVYTFASNTSAKASLTWNNSPNSPGVCVANITRFRLNAKRGGVAAEYSSAGLSNVDLFSPGALSSIISIPKGDYNGVKAAIVFSPTTASPNPLELSGTYTTAGGTAIPVKFELNDNLEISVAVADIIADGTKDFTTNITMRLNQFLAGVTAMEIDAAPRTSGTIVISKTVNTTIYNKIKANMLLCGSAALSSRNK